MSQASSAASMCSVTFQNQQMSLEEALDQTIRGVQNSLNDLQVALRQLANVEEQQIDTEEDFKEAVKLEDTTTDLVNDLVNLLEELPSIASDIRGKVPKELKDWHLEHKARRKEAQALKKQAEKAEALLLRNKKNEKSEKQNLPALAE